MVIGINFWEAVIIIVVALVVIGPERLPHYAARLRTGVRELRRMATGAKEQLREQMGPEFDDIDWKAYDPRQYDPRRIVREALLEDDEDEPRTDGGTGEPESTRTGGATAAAAPSVVTAERRRPRAVAYDPTAPTPFDPEAT
ncbi:twin-arginine translocase TatA/TatE family subunit [Agilicoccus flavus]|uniref:twin-arginine translocase TatA/TatE family subunit n=1 Tax=Agilicoccus flavus TaxID=2775968 RepID=UPI0027D9F29A|nr:twin-arginine translocase TatA/TatE family subunit [Agilicoccus flavus]